MTHRKCAACKKETAQDNDICEHCHKAVFAIDFGPKASSFRRIPRHKVYQECFWLPIVPPPAHGPKSELVCSEYEPVVFNG